MVIGKVSAIFMNPKIEFSFSKDASSEKIHITRAHLIVTEKTKFIPTYDSNIPLVCFIYNFLIATIESGSITLINGQGGGGTTLELLQYFYRNDIS